MAHNVDRWISIARPTAAYPFAIQIASRPLDVNPTATASSSSSGPPSLACTLSHGRGVGHASSCHFGAGINGTFCNALIAVVHCPRKSSTHLLPSPSELPWQS